MFEAARWAPSSFNTQQWRALYARRGTEHWQTFFDLLVDANKAWAKNAAVLVVFISRKIFDHNDEPSVTHSYDCGAAGRISRCKASTKVWWCTGCKDSITIGRAKNCGFLTNSKSKRWQQSAGQVRKNCFLKNYRRAKAQTIDGKFRKASLRGRLGLNRFWPNDRPLLKGEPAVVVPPIQNSAVTALAAASVAPITITQRNPNTKDSSIARRISWCVSGFRFSGISIAASFID